MAGRQVWRALLPIALFGSGLLFATTATTAHGTDLRAGRKTELSSLINERSRQVKEAELDRQERARELDRATRQRSRTDERLTQPQQNIDALDDQVGLTSVQGPAITVSLNDAPQSARESLPAGATPDDLVVHQQDVQAVVNALWVGGAEAMTIMGQRIVATSAVRCVGNTLLLHGQTYSPPFQITAIGEPNALTAALESSSGVNLFRRAAQSYGLGYRVTVEPDDTVVPPYQGSTQAPNSRTSR